MKSRKKLLFLLIPLLLVIFWTGIPISVGIEEAGCSATYKKYLIPRVLCQTLTSNHCETTDFNLSNAERQIARCLCDRYLEKANEDLGRSIIKKCPNDCRSIISNMRYENCPSESAEDYSRDCMMKYFEISENLSDNVEFICENKDKIFLPLHMY